MVQQNWQRSVYLLFFDVAFTDMKSLFGQEKRSYHERYRRIPKFVIDHDENKLAQPMSTAQKMKFSIKDLFLQQIWPNPQFSADLVIFAVITSFFVPKSDREMGLCYISVRLFNYSFTYLNWSSHTEVFLKGVLKICSKFTGEHPYQSVISIKLLASEHSFVTLVSQMI